VYSNLQDTASTGSAPNKVNAAKVVNIGHKAMARILTPIAQESLKRVHTETKVKAAIALIKMAARLAFAKFPE
jgi:hypothetical protein